MFSLINIIKVKLNTEFSLSLGKYMHNSSKYNEMVSSKYCTYYGVIVLWNLLIN